jgi:excisionase family DNA binding protein
MSETSDTMTVREAAEILGVHQTTIIRAINDGRLHAIVKRSPLAKRATAYLLSRQEVERIAKEGLPDVPEQQMRMIAETPAPYSSR